MNFSQNDEPVLLPPTIYIVDGGNPEVTHLGDVCYVFTNAVDTFLCVLQMLILIVGYFDSGKPNEKGINVYQITVYIILCTHNPGCACARERIKDVSDVGMIF